jgi:pyruvate formate lyase activating enzyme
MHFTAFHPDFRMMDKEHTPLATLQRAQRIARKNGVRYAYTGNVSNPHGESTFCHACGALLVERDRYELSAWGLTGDGRCVACGEAWAGVVEGRPGRWGARRLPVMLDGAD